MVENEGVKPHFFLPKQEAEGENASKDKQQTNDGRTHRSGLVIQQTITNLLFKALLAGFLIYYPYSIKKIILVVKAASAQSPPGRPLCQQ